MRAYETHRFTQYPDVGDILSEGRKSSVGRLDKKSYCNPRGKAAARRGLKRADRARAKGRD
jgi:hypothetical protein